MDGVEVDLGAGNTTLAGYRAGKGKDMGRADRPSGDEVIERY